MTVKLASTDVYLSPALSVYWPGMTQRREMYPLRLVPSDSWLMESFLWFFSFALLVDLEMVAMVLRYVSLRLWF